MDAERHTYQSNLKKWSKHFKNKFQRLMMEVPPTEIIAEILIE